MKYSRIYPNATMASDWNVIAEIREAMNELKATAKQPYIHHTYDHQDEEGPYKELSLKAQLNCDADELANIYLEDHPDLDHTRVPILPTSGCQLDLDKGTITYNLKRELKYARSAKQLKRKLMNRDEWDESTFDDIDWTDHGRALI